MADALANAGAAKVVHSISGPKAPAGYERRAMRRALFGAAHAVAKSISTTCQCCHVIKSQTVHACSRRSPSCVLLMRGSPCGCLCRLMSDPIAPSSKCWTGLCSSGDTLAVALTRLCHLTRVCASLWCCCCSAAAAERHEDACCSCAAVALTPLLMTSLKHPQTVS